MTSLVSSKNMEFYYRENSVNFGYVTGKNIINGTMAYFFLTSATNFGSFQNWIKRIRNRKVDHVVMKRAFIMSSPGDRVYVSIGKADPAIMMENFTFARKLYNRAGFEVGEILPITGNPYNYIKKEAKCSAIATIIFDPRLYRIFGNKRLLQAVEILNDKVRSMEYFRSRGIDLPKSIHLNKTAMNKELKKALEEIGFPCYFKSRQGAGGWNVWYIQDFSEAVSLLKKGISGTFQIQEYIPGKESLNIQYLVLPDRVERLLVTKQRIKEERFHMGNDWPAHCNNNEYADRVAEECRNLGFIGVMGLDMKQKLIEVNPRQNSSGEMQIILRRIPGIRKLSISIRHIKKTTRLSDLNLDNLWYNGEIGLLPFEWHDGEGELSVAIINDRDGYVEAEFRKLCPQN